MALTFDPETLPWIDRPIPGLRYLWVPSSALDAHLEGGFEMTGSKSKPDGAHEFYHLLKTGEALPGLADGSIAPDVSVYVPDVDQSPPAPPVKAPEPKPRRSALESLSE